tara:strand:- start:353 stop:556 length:204 start_codon:yes stop_codon:yes gene_type:complete
MSRAGLCTGPVPVRCLRVVGRFSVVAACGDGGQGGMEDIHTQNCQIGLVAFDLRILGWRPFVPCVWF